MVAEVVTDMHTVINKLLIIILLPIFLSCAELGYFTPPDHWNCARPKSLSPTVEIAFFTKFDSPFHPSINLAKEHSNLSLKEYLKIAKKIHLSEPDTDWRDLGEFHCKAGKGRLTEISQKNRWGELRLLQFIFLHNKTIYVMTGASTKKEFSKVRKNLIQSFKSFTITNDLYAEIRDTQKKNEIINLISHMEEFAKSHERKKSEKEWKKIQNQIVGNLHEEGQHFQFLFLKDLHESKILPLLGKK